MNAIYGDSPEIDSPEIETYLFPCSFAQQRLWFLNQLVQNNPFYNIHVAVNLNTPIDSSKLEMSINEIIRRHESLRTRFISENGQPMQIVAASLYLPLRILDLSHLETTERHNEVIRIANEEAQGIFDLQRGPLLRVALLTLGDSEHILLLTVHHIVADAWSMGVLFRELTELYSAFSLGRESPLEELAIQYADFSVWQREWLQGEVLDEQLSYWRERLADLPNLQLPTDFSRPPVASYKGASLEFSLPDDLAKDLIEFSCQQGVTLFMTLLSVFKVLLHRYTSQDDIVVGAPIANRNRPEIEGLIGFFVNTLVLRTDCSDTPDFLQFLARVRDVSLGAYVHQDLPFEKLVELLQPERDLSRNPLFQVTFQVLNSPTTVSGQTSSDKPVLDVQRGAANFDLGMDLWQTTDGISGRVDYSTDLFERSSIIRMVGHFRTLLEGIMTDPRQKISQLPMLTEVEKQQLLVEFNATATEYPRQASICQIFEAQVSKTPENTAVQFDAEHLTYRELNRRANQLANLLLGQGVVVEEAIGLCMDRSVDMIVSLLAILKAGAVYVALDPNYPSARLSLLRDDAKILKIISSQQYRDLLKELQPNEELQHNVQVICLEDEINNLKMQAEANPVLSIPATNLAYIAYTSGSTGTPKGVCVTHRSCVRLVKKTNYLDFSSEQVFLQLAPLGFDASTLEIWGPLLNGANLVIHPPYAPSLEELGEFIEKHGVTVLWLSAGLFHQMVDRCPNSLAKVKQLLAGGDALSANAVKTILTLPGQRCLVNGYGPTECTTFACCYVMTDPETIGDRVAIGRPIANTRVYVLDKFMNPVPIGVPGELYIGGDGVARGYLNQPELTDEKFVNDPFDKTHKGKLYRTGDQVRHRTDGILDFLGRIDRQVKVRGFRIEPGEIETVLENNPIVKTAVVVANTDHSGDKHLVAYIVLENAQSASKNELRRYLHDYLPAYMVPTDMVFLDKIPLTSNGKLNIMALPKQAESAADDGSDFVAPQSELEEMLTAIWQEILEVECISTKADFFTELGGHSLLATQAVSRIREVFDLELPLHKFFEFPNIAGLAITIEGMLIDELEAVADEEIE